jgi:hypothetical protein
MGAFSAHAVACGGLRRARHARLCSLRPYFSIRDFESITLQKKATSCGTW